MARKKLTGAVHAHPKALKEKAVKLYGLGHSAASIAKSLGVSYPSVTKWAKEAGVEKGSAAPQFVDSEDQFLTPLELDDTVPLNKVIANAEDRKDIVAVAKQASSPAEQYQTLVAANAIKLLQSAFENPPIVKNIRDLKTLTDIANAALGVGSKRGGGVGGKLAIDLRVLSGPKEGPTVEAEIVETS
jgi:hypothetical protein